MNHHAVFPLDIKQGTLLIDIATRNVMCFAEDDCVSAAARSMAERRISSIVVTDAAGRPAGIVTERNILQAMQGGCPQDEKLRNIMSSLLVTVPVSIGMLDAYQLCLRNGIRHLVIVNHDGLLEGVVSETDFRLHMNLTALAGHRSIASAMNRSVIGMSPQATLRDALELMQSHRDSCVVVVENGQPAGIVTERDVVRLYAGMQELPAIPLRDIMTSPVLTLRIDDSLNEAARSMLEARVRHLVVIDGHGKLAGLISEHDLTQAMALGLIDDELAAEGSFLRTLINTIPDLIWLKNTDGVYLACNTRFEQFFGAGEQDIVGKTDYDFADRQLADFFREHDRIAMAAGHPTVNEEWLTFAADGYRGLFETVKTPMLDRNGRTVGVLGIARDITARRLLEEKLEDSEKKFHNIFESVGDCIEIISTDGIILDMNRAGYERQGYTRAEMVGRPLSDFAAPGYTERMAERMAAIRKQGHITFESARLHKDGTAIPLEVSSRLVEMDGQQVFLGISRDISERKRAEAELRASEEKLRSLYELSPMGIALTDMQGGYVEFNDAFRDICGYTRDELNRLDYWALTPKEYAAQEAQQLELLKTRGYYGPYEKEYIRKDGSRIPLRLNGVRIHGSDGQPYIWSIVEDITERKHAEAVLATSEFRYRTLVENSPFCIHEIDLDGRLQSMNQAGLCMLGLDDEEKIRGVPYMSAVGKQDYARIAALMQAAYGGKSSHFEFTGSGDAPQYFKSCFIPIRDAGGKVVKLMGITEDITERKRTEDALRRREEIFSTIVNQAADSIVLIDSETLQIVEFNPTAHESLGYTREEFAALTVADIQAQLSPAQIKQRIRLSIEKNETLLFETQHRRKDGSIRETQVSSRPVTIHGKSYVSGIWSDITKRKRDEQVLRITASVFDTTQEAILITDPANNIVDVNPAFSRITGYSREEVLGHNPRLLSSGRQDKAFYKTMWKALTEKKSWRGEIWNRRKNGESYAELLSISVICDGEGKVLRHVGVFSDISPLKAHEAELSRVAHYDALTGIPNRVLLADRLKQAFAQTAREGNMLAVCYLDLDGFKPINDTLGHEAGDEVLVEIARRIETTIRGGDTVARLGGDEFVVALLGLEKGEECVATLGRLLAAIDQPIMVRGHSLTVSASIGVSIYPLDDEDPDTLLRHADQAMYVAKQSGKNRFHIYDPALDLRARNQHEFLQSLRHGLKHGEFALYYQPKVDLRDKRLVGAEALIRWHHPERGLLPPSEFLRLVENTELDIEIGDWVISTALAQLEHWQRTGFDIEVSINISAYHLESPRFTEKLRRKLEHHPDVPPGRLQIEVLETAALNDIAIVRGIIDACRSLGVTFALDDFGTGYSSLSYLGSLPVDVLKIDQTFVRDMLEDKGDMAIVQGIVALAHAFERKTVAEGIESDAHYRALLDLGCGIGQGYGIARPMPADDLINWAPQQ